MRIRISVLTVVAAVLAVSAVFIATGGSTVPEEVKVKSFYEIDVMDIDGNNVNLGKYKDHVVMFVNTASQCGYTPQYKGLQKIYDKFKDRGFVILGFPANNFGGQEPGSNAEIKEFCTLRYKVTFPMFAKISVKGEDQHQLYKYLTSEEASGDFAGEITWNFNKILANHEGEIINRFSSKETPESKGVVEAIEAALEERENALEKDAGPESPLD